MHRRKILLGEEPGVSSDGAEVRPVGVERGADELDGDIEIAFQPLLDELLDLGREHLVRDGEPALDGQPTEPDGRPSQPVRVT